MLSNIFAKKILQWHMSLMTLGALPPRFWRSVHPWIRCIQKHKHTSNIVFGEGAWAPPGEFTPVPPKYQHWQRSIHTQATILQGVAQSSKEIYTKNCKSYRPYWIHNLHRVSQWDKTDRHSLNIPSMNINYIIKTYLKMPAIIWVLTWRTVYKFNFFYSHFFILCLRKMSQLLTNLHLQFISNLTLD